MKITELINSLQQLLDEHGDLEICTFSYNGGRANIHTPSIAYKKILNKRESMEKFWYDGGKGTLEQKGEKVVRL